MKKLLPVVLIGAAVFLSYAPSLRDGFVWDDTALILRDPLIRSWRLIPEGFNHFLFTDATASNFYRPIQRLTYTLEYAAFVFKPGPYHFTSIICHAMAAIALFFMTQELLVFFGADSAKRWLLALLATLVWAIHPVQSAAVVYVSGRADPLAAAFGFVGLYLVLRSKQTNRRRGLLLLAAAAIAFVLSALSKESGLIFPLLAIALLAVTKNWIDMFKATGVLIFVAVVYLSLRLSAEQIALPVWRPPAPAMVRPILMARAVAEYTGLILLPINLHMDRDVETSPAGFNDRTVTAAAWRELQTLLGILLVVAFIYWMIRARARHPSAFACLLLAATSYLPISGIAALNASVAEHWLYLPSALLFVAASIQAADFLQNKGSAIRLAATAIFVFWFLFLATRTFIRTFDWKDQRTFVEQTIANGGDSARMLINRAGVEISEGKLPDAAISLHAALQKTPNQPLAVLNLASVALKQNDFKLARELLTRATDMLMVAAQAHELLAVLEHKETGQVDFVRLRLAARTGPPDWSIEKRYIMVLDESGATAQAISELENCLRTQWYRAESWQLLGQLLAKTGRTTAADVALAQARAYDVHLAAQTPPL